MEWIIFKYLFYILTLLVVYDLSKRVLKKEKLALLSMFLCGSCVGIVSCAIFIRVYMMLTFFTVALMDSHVYMLARLIQPSMHLLKRIFTYLCLVSLFIIGSLSQYYFIIYSFFVCLIFWIILLFAKEYRFAVEYALAMSCAVILYFALWPNFFRDLFSEARGVEAISNFAATQSTFLIHVIHYLQDIDKLLIGGFGLLFLTVGVMLVLYKVFSTYTPGLKLNGETLIISYIIREKK